MESLQHEAFLSIRPTALELRRSSLWLADHCREGCVPDGSIGRLDLCLNEVLTNLIDHGEASASRQPVDLRLALMDRGDRGRASLTISDAGPVFDPLSVPAPPRPHSLEDTQPGGLGLLLVRRLMEDRAYERIGERNVLTLALSWPKGS